MRIATVIHVLGFLLMFLAAAMLLPLPFSFYYKGGDHLAFLWSAGVTFLAGFLSFVLTRMRAQDLRTKEGFAIVTFAWIFLSVFGALPFYLSGAIPSVTDAFFETMSGFTTTGASVLTDIEAVPRGVLFWRSLTHWIGGMGIIVLSIAILPFLGIGGMQMFKAEVPGPTADKLTPRIAETAKILWSVYVLISAVEVLLLLLGGMSFFDSLCHTFGTMATGGFSTRNASIGAYENSYLHYVITFFMLLAGTNFALHHRFLRKDRHAYVRNTEFMFYLSIIGISFLIIAGDVYFNTYQNVGLTLRDSLFQVVSIMTTTGYGTADYEKWQFSSQFVLFALMFFGGCAGSTGGGMKIIRVHLIAKFAFAEVTRLLHPHAVVRVRVGGEVVPREVIGNVLGFFIAFVGVFMLGVLAMSALGLDMATSFGATIATLANIGPGLGSVGPTDNYAHIPLVGKWILSMLMLLGRLELLTVIVLLSPYYWKH